MNWMHLWSPALSVNEVILLQFANIGAGDCYFGVSKSDQIY